MYTKKHLFVAACAGVLVATLIGLAIVTYWNTAQRDGSIAMGTYATWEGKVPGCEYMVFDHEGRYFLYRQFEPLDTGTFSKREDGIYTLISARGAGDLDVLLKENTVYRTGSDGELYVYSKIAEIPNFINLSATDF